MSIIIFKNFCFLATIFAKNRGVYMQPDATVRFTISLPSDLLDTLDHQILAKSTSSRSEFIRDLIREKLIDSNWQDEKKEVVGVLTLIYDHHQRELLQKMTDIQHNAKADILCTTHIHLDHHNCLETIMIKGAPKEVEQIVDAIGGLKGVNFSALTKTAVF